MIVVAISASAAIRAIPTCARPHYLPVNACIITSARSTAPNSNGVETKALQTALARLPLANNPPT